MMMMMMIMMMMMMMMAMHRLWFALLLCSCFLYRSINAQQQQSSCTVCYEGGSYDETAKIGSSLCSDLEPYLRSTPANHSSCLEFQLQTFLHCGCAKFPSAYCSMCEDGVISLTEPDKVLPTLGKSCYDSLFALQSDGDTCSQIAAVSYVCGCPGAVPAECTLCDNGFPVIANRPLPPTFAMTCWDYEAQAAMMDQDNCNSIAADLPIDVPGYCGCGTNPVNDCVLCSKDDESLASDVILTLQGVELSCNDLSVMALFVTDPTYCETLRSETAECCQSNSFSNAESDQAKGDSSTTDGVTSSSPVLVTMYAFGTMVSFMSMWI